MKVSDKGAVALLIPLLRGMLEQKTYGCLALKFLVFHNDANGNEVINSSGGVRLLVKLLDGTDR